MSQLPKQILTWPEWSKIPENRKLIGENIQKAKLKYKNDIFLAEAYNKYLPTMLMGYLSPSSATSAGGSSPSTSTTPVEEEEEEESTPEDVGILCEILDTYADGGEIAMVKHIDSYSIATDGTLSISCLGVSLPLLHTNEPETSIGCVANLEFGVDGETQLICGDGTTPASCQEIDATFTLLASVPRPALLLFSMYINSYPSEANFRFTIGGTCLAAKGEGSGGGDGGDGGDGGSPELPCDNMIIDPFPPPETPTEAMTYEKWFHMYATINAAGNVQYMWDPDGTQVYP